MSHTNAQLTSLRDKHLADAKEAERKAVEAAAQALEQVNEKVESKPNKKK